MSYIKGKYTTEIFSNSTNGYTVGVIKILETDISELKNKNSTYFVGTFADLKLKSNYEMHGELIVHKKYGVQFEVETYEQLIPEKKDELIEFLSSDLFPIGEKTAKKIVDKFKNKTIEIILNNPNSLLLIPKLSETKIKKIHETLKEYKATSSIVLELNKLGFSTKDSLTILNRYKNKSLDQINDNIYSLIDELDFNFKLIDEIALNNNINPIDERRLSALIIYSLNEITFENGDTYSFIEEIYSSVSKHVEIDIDKLEYELIKLNKKGKIIIENNKYYLKKLYEAEKYITDRLCFLNDMKISNLPKLEEKLNELEEKNHIIYDEIQKKAIIKAINNNLTIITGGPGTGKTTIIKAIVDLLIKTCKIKKEEIALLAPTGRASKKLMETTNMPAYTIHKYLGWDKEKNTFRVNEYFPNPEKYIIIDETSMIDTILMSSLLKGIKRGAKLILVGDYFQLPSVSQGQVLKDLIESELLEVIKLNRLYRQNEESYITTLAYEIKDKDLNEHFMNKKDDYSFIPCSSEYVLPHINEIVNIAISKGFDDKTIQILAPMYKTVNGIDNLNKSLQLIFNPFDTEKNEISIGEVTYRENDKVLQLINDPDNNVFNGDIGYIKSIVSNKETTEITIDYDGNIVTYNREKFINFRHGYAISIHKAQGSEFNMVIIPFVNSFKRMLYNKLVYTAVTRAKNKLILIGDPNSFIYGIKNDYIDNRKTTLKEFIKSKYNYKK